MSHSLMSSLPEEGLEHVKQIVLTDNPNLKQLPSIFVFTSLQEAHLTYPYHCCLFKVKANEHVCIYVELIKCKYIQSPPDFCSMLKYPKLLAVVSPSTLAT